MFRETVAQTPFVTEVADVYFSHITGDYFREDLSFLSTLRALVAPRMGEDESIHLRFRDVIFDEAYCSSVSSESAVRHIVDAPHLPDGSICVCNFVAGNAAGNDAGFAFVKDRFCAVFNGWIPIKKITEFYQKTMDVLCYVNRRGKKVVLFTNNMSVQKMHYLQCSTFAFLPWYFDPAAGISDDEMALVRSLRETDAAAYKSCIGVLAAQYDFRACHIQRGLSGFESRFVQQERARALRDIASADEEVAQLNERIRIKLRAKRNQETRLLGLDARLHTAQGESELMNYFLRNKKLTLLGANNTGFSFYVREYLNYFEEAMAEKSINNTHSVLYSPAGHFSPEEKQSLLRAIFITQELTIKTCACFSVNVEDLLVDGVQIPSLPDGFDDCMPNPHINLYQCMGDHKEAAQLALANGCYIAAVEQCIASSKNLNFADGTVARIFAIELFEKNGGGGAACIELPDGSSLTPADAIKWLKEREGSSS